MIQTPSSAEVALHSIPGSRVRALFGRGAVGRVGGVVNELGGRRVLLVTDPGIVAAGHVGRAVSSLVDAGMVVEVFDGAAENPTTQHVDAGLTVAARFRPDSIVGLGGGSSMDCAKGINFLHTSGGRMQDYWGTGKAKRDMLPLVAIPTTAGTGSEAQSYALIIDPATHQKMACGDPRALPRVAILDPELVATVPDRVAAAAGIDAVTHAVESSASTRRTAVSRELSRHAWVHLDRAFDAALGPVANRTDAARADMLMGAHLAGAAIENAMLGAAHACANPLTARFGLPHGVAVGVMLPQVVTYNARGGVNPYSDLAAAEDLVARLGRMQRVAGLPHRLRELGVPEDSLASLAEMAARQWTAQFNPRPVGAAELLRVYRAAF